MLVFTEGLDESALDWIKQGSEVEQQTHSVPLTPVSPPPQTIHKKIPLDSILSSYFSPKLHLQCRSSILGSAASFSGSGEESVGSVPDDCFTSSTGQDVSAGFDEEMEIASSSDSVNGPVSQRRGGLVRAKSKENLRVDVPGLGVCDNFIHGYMAEQLGPPSAPPMPETQRMDINLDTDVIESFQLSVGAEVQEKKQLEEFLSSPQENDFCSTRLEAPTLTYTASVQNAWEGMVAYEACNRLCLNAHARNCLLAGPFLQSDCLLLRNAFGIQKFLLHPKGQNPCEGKNFEFKESSTCGMKGRKIIYKIEVEVKKVRIIPPKSKLKASNSLRSIQLQTGMEYVKNVTKILKGQLSNLNRPSLSSIASSICPEECIECLLELRSDPNSNVKLYPGTGDLHIFYPEGQGDVISLEVQSYNGTVSGRTTIPVSCLADRNGQTVQWFDLFLDDFECVGKVQLAFNVFVSSDSSGSAKISQGGKAVETLIYDLVLEAAMRSENFHAKNLHIKGPWKWLLDEFADFYGISDSYENLRYLYNVLNVAIPTKDCLDFIYELILPVLKAQGEQKLTRQERSILIDCEDQIKKLLAKTFENYKSLDDSSHTGLTDLFCPVVESVGLALNPAVRLFGLLNDLLSLEAQNLMRTYLQTGVAKRCRRYLLETEEFVTVNNSDLFMTDIVTVSTAYTKMKSLSLKLAREINSDIKIHKENIFPSSIDLPKIAATHYSTELQKRIRVFLSACPPSRPFNYVQNLLISAVDFEMHLATCNLRPENGGINSRDLFDGYILSWIEDTRLHLLDLCKTELSSPQVVTSSPISPFVEQIYEKIKEGINEYEFVIKRWPDYLIPLEIAIADVEREVITTLEKQYSENLALLRDGIPKIIEKKVMKIGKTLEKVFSPNYDCSNRDLTSIYVVPIQLGTFMNSLKRMLDILHPRAEEMMKLWDPFMTIKNGENNNNSSFGEHMNSISVMLKRKYKKYLESIVKKLVHNTQSCRSTKLKRVLEEISEVERESETRERMHPLCTQVADSIRNLHQVFSQRIFIDVTRGLWDKLGKIVLSFLHSRQENRTSYRGSAVALGIIDDLLASEMQKLMGSSLKEEDLKPPQSVREARSILF